MRCKDIRICQMNISTLVLCRLDVNYAQNFIQNSFWILKTIGQIYNELQFWWCRLRNNLRQKKNRKKVAYGWVLGYGFDITKTVANMDIFLFAKYECSLHRATKISIYQGLSQIPHSVSVNMWGQIFWLYAPFYTEFFSFYIEHFYR